MKWTFWLVSIPFVLMVMALMMVIALIGTGGELVRRSAAWALKVSEPLPRWYGRHIPDSYSRAPRRR